MTTVRSAPRVSVVIPTYNSARYLDDAIQSVLAQDYADFELLVVDDASTDDTADHVARYRDPRVRYLRNDTQRGIAGARNRGIDAARGEFIASLDGDDRAYPSRLSCQVAFLDAHPDHAAVGSWARWMDAEGRARPGVTRRPTDWRDASAQLIYKSSLQQPSVTARAAILAEYRYDESFRLSSDYELWTRIATHHRLASQPRALVRCRRHTRSTTRSQHDGVIACQRRIFARQLDRLGLRYRDEDLEGHRLLWRPGKRGDELSRDTLAWAEDWLMRLAAANARERCYPDAAFRAVLGWGWCQIGFSALRSRSPRAAARWSRGAPMRFVASALQRRVLKRGEPRGPLGYRRHSTGSQ
ncbi:glycosyltransferase family 2 protein [Salinisphaera hydrothermalis]|uniref:glycosyltransferase family 2 protein n=1 Tax=Salinisphaera hydrothermalis TaxID=563188 RepID=UPI0033407A9D